MRNTKFVRTMLTIALVLTIIGSVTGGTIAWFTDAVVSNNNIVKSGKLDIDLQLKDYENDTWISLEKEENANVKVFDYGLWEPGFTQMETLKIVNKGNLAFEYILKVVPDGADKTTVNGVEKTLADAIDVYMVFDEKTPADFSGITEANGWTKVGTLASMLGDTGLIKGVMLPAGETSEEAGVVSGSVTCTVALHMQESAGNEYQNLSLGTVGITLEAKQYTYEEDAFGNQYDLNAPWHSDPSVNNEPVAWVVGDDDRVNYEIPAGAVKVASSADLTEKVANGATVLLLAPGEYDVNGCGGKTLTLVGEDLDKTVINIVGTGSENNGQSDYGFDGSTVTFQNLTIKSNNQTYAGFVRMNGIYKNVNFVNTYCLYSTSEFEFCTLDITGDQYNIWTWGAPTAKFSNCTFNSDGKAVLLYGQVNTKLTLNDCLFNDNGGLSDLKAAVEIGNDYNKSYELIVNNTTINGYEINNKGINTGTTLWGNKNSMGTDKLNVVVDGVDVY